MQSEPENIRETSGGRGSNPESAFSRKRTFRLSFKSRKVTPGGRKQQLQQQQQLQLVNEDEQRPLEDRKPAPATTSTTTTSTNPDQRSTSPVVREPVVYSVECTRGKTCGKNCENSHQTSEQEKTSEKNCRNPRENSQQPGEREKTYGYCEHPLENSQQPGERSRLVSSTSSSSVKSYDREVNIKQWVEVEKKNPCEGPAIYKSVVKEIIIKTKETVRVDTCSSQVNSGQTNNFQNYYNNGQTTNSQNNCETCNSGFKNNGDKNYRVLTKFEKVLGERIVLHDNKTVVSCCCTDENCDIEDKKTLDEVGLENPGYNFVPDRSGVTRTEQVGDFEVPRVDKPIRDYFEIREPYKGLENAGFVEYSTNPFLEPCAGGIVNEAIEEENEDDEEVDDVQNKKCSIEKYPCGIENAAFESVNSTNPFLPCYLPQEIEGPNSENGGYESEEDEEESFESSHDGDICPELYGTDNLGFDNRCQIADSSVESLPSLLAVDEAYLQRMRDGSPVEITSNVESDVELPPSILVPRGGTQKRKRKSVHFSKTVNISDGVTIRKKKMKKLADLNGRIKNDIKKRRTIVGSGTENFGFCENPLRPLSRLPSALPVVSLYSTPPRHYAKRQKSGNLENNDKLLKAQKLVSVPEAIKENYPVFPEIRPNRLSKIVKRLGPEVLTATATGTSTTDSVLAQVMKQHYHDNNADGVNNRRTGDKCSGNVGNTDDLTNTGDNNCDQNRRRRKRKSPHDIFDGASTGPNPIKESVPPTRGKKLPRMDIHLHALFAAVEHGHVEKARTILESTDVDVNSANSDGLSPLDVAVLSNNRQLTKMLIAFGAREGNQFGSSDKLSSHLHHLAREADHHVQELGGSGGETDNRTYTQTASDKTLALWERRSRGLNKMILGFDQARPPDVPFLVVADVTGTDSVTVRYQEPEHHDSPVCTKYRVEWSCCPDFGALAGFIEVLDPRQLECHVDGLDRGRRYYFRVACGNIRGFGNFRMSYPQSIIPSSWRDVVQKEERLPSSGLALFDRLFQEVRSARPDLKGVGSPSASGETPLGQRRKKTTIKQLFTAASKFQKHLRRGVYFSCLLYNEDKVLVTNEDFLPVIEVDETYPGSIYHDFHWLLKVACTWDDVKWLKQDMEKSLSSSAVHFRIKLLQAAVQMQTALSIQDLGQLYHKPLRDSEGTIVVCTVNYVKSPKSVSVLNSRWLPLGKLTKRAVQPTSETSIGDILMASIQEQITYHQVSSIRLPRGLYLGYLKMRSSVDLLQVLVPTKSPNVPPHCKIRDNSHVTAEEWEWLRIGCASNDCTEQQKDFVEQVAATARRLFTYMEVPCDEAPSHRLYDGEVVELSSEVSFLMVVPPPESACAAPGQRDLLLQRPDLVPLPVQVFEMVHMGTYQKQLVSRYSRLSCILELDTALAQHSHREAFSSSEVSVARERLARLEGLQAQLNAAWKSARWLLDVLAFARDRLAHSPTSIRHLLQKRSRDHLEASHNGLLQPPDPKSVKSRGSWPGPGVARLLGSCTAEMSRSDQHLSGGAPPPPPTPHQLLHAHTPSPSSSPNRPAPPPLPPPRPTPARPPPPNDHIETIRLPPSRSEDTLHMHTRITPRTRATVSATTSPLLPSRPTGYGSGSLQSSSEESALANQSSKSEGEAEEEGATVPAPAPGILQVYAAYETGLAAGTSLKLHVSPRTSAREVVDLVVKQLNMAVVLKGKDGPIYAADQLSNFCLVAVIGARERCLRDDFKPLQLQNPWKKGRLYVRQKHDVLAALEHSSRHSALL